MGKFRLLPAALAAAVVAISGSAAGAPPKPSFPVTVQAANGAVTLARQPTRIVSLSPTATEILFAVGAGRQVVAVDALSNYPKRAPRTKLSGYQPNVEAIAGYHPDLVVSRSDGGLVETLKKLKIPILVDPEAANLASAYQQIRQLGKATGHGESAGRLVERMQRQIGVAITSAEGAGLGLSVYHELTTDYYSATSKTFIGQIYRLFGLRNIADAAQSSGSPYPQLSAEYILSANPDLVFLADSKCCGQNLDAVAARPGWGNVTAVKRRQVVALDDDVVSRWGPRVVQFVRSVAANVRQARR